jgi:hypothetical protein
MAQFSIRVAELQHLAMRIAQKERGGRRRPFPNTISGFD